MSKRARTTDSPNQADAIGYLRQWLAAKGVEPAQISPLAGDASLRRYYRIEMADGGRAILMDSRREPESLRDFLARHSDLSEGGLRVPVITCADTEAGIVWLEDAGDTTLLDHLTIAKRASADGAAPAADPAGDKTRLEDRAATERTLPDGATPVTNPAGDEASFEGRAATGRTPADGATPVDDPVIVIYRRAIDELLTVQAMPCAHLRAYDAELLRAEMDLFRDWFAAKEIRWDIEEAGWQDHWRAAQDTLIDNALSQPQVWVHRDYHSRNMMITPADARPVLLDFQDAVRGAVCYDIVSLLRDYYAPLERGQFDFLRAHYYALSPQLIGVDRAAFERHFDLSAAQRHLKVIGIFTRLKRRDGKDGYLADIPQAWEYLRGISARYAELRWLDELINSAPIHDWMSQARA